MRPNSIPQELKPHPSARRQASYLAPPNVLNYIAKENRMLKAMSPLGTMLSNTGFEPFSKGRSYWRKTILPATTVQSYSSPLKRLAVVPRHPLRGFDRHEAAKKSLAANGRECTQIPPPIVFDLRPFAAKISASTRGHWRRSSTRTSPTPSA